MLSVLYRIVGPVIRRIDPERAHGLALAALRLMPPAPTPAPAHPMLAQSLWGRHFACPVGVAAGFDKNAAVADKMGRFGFAFAEVGSVTPRPQPGNARPRMFRLHEDAAVINRLGFNNKGADHVATRLARLRARHGRRLLVGVNLGANKETADRAEDYVSGLERFAPFADYCVVNVSSPNTPGLRNLQAADALADLLARLARARRNDGPPLLLKIAPDLENGALDDIVALALEHGLDGLIVSNTTIARPATLRSTQAREQGGLSGQPLFPFATGMLARAFLKAERRLPLIGVGGIASAEQAYDKIKAGATLLQLYTAMIYRGPALARDISRRLPELLAADGLTHIRHAIGRDAERWANR